MKEPQSVRDKSVVMKSDEKPKFFSPKRNLGKSARDASILLFSQIA